MLMTVTVVISKAIQKSDVNKDLHEKLSSKQMIDNISIKI